MSTYNELDLEYVAKEIEDAQKDIGLTYVAYKYVESTSELDLLYGENTAKEKQELFTTKGIVKINPTQEELSPIGYSHNACIYFVASRNQLQECGEVLYEDGDNVMLHLDKEHSIVNNSGDKILTLQDVITFKGQDYRIVNIEPQSTLVEDILLYRIECIN